MQKGSDTSPTRVPASSPSLHTLLLHYSTLHYSISLESIRSEAEDVRKRFDAVIVMARHH